MKTVAVIGCGKAAEGKEGWAIGHAHARGYLGCGHEVKLLGVDLSPENLAAFGETFNLPDDQLFASTEALYAALTPDCVSVCTWPALHKPMVLEAIARGVKGIACEKPLAMDVGEIREIERSAKEAGTVVVVAHQRCYNPVFQALKAFVGSGKLGNDLRFEGHVGDGWDILSWTTHWFDMANFVFDAPPQSVLAGMDVTDARRYQQAVENSSVVYADYGEGRSAVFVTGPGEGSGVRVLGSEGWVRPGGNGIIACTRTGFETIEPDAAADFAGDFAALMKAMIEAVDGGPEPLCSLARCAVATEMAYAAQESARTTRAVCLPMPVQFAPLEVLQHPPSSALAGKRVLLYADAHFGSGGREGLAGALASLTGLETTVIDAEAEPLRAADLEGVDAVAIYHTQQEATEETRQALSAWVEAGRPLLVVHAGLGAWPEWEDYTAWCGRVWQWDVSVHPHEAAGLSVPAGDPLGFGWRQAWLPRDEVFVKLKDTAAVTDGLHAEISSGTFPVAWRLVDRPAVGAWMPGHRGDSWQVPAMRAGLGALLRLLVK